MTQRLFSGPYSIDIPQVHHGHYQCNFHCILRKVDLYKLKSSQITKYDMAISNNVREVKRDIRSTKVLKDHCFSVVLYSTLINHFTW